MLALLLMTGCTSKIHSQFDEAKRYALEEAGAAPASWAPEAAIWLADDVVEVLLLKAVNAALADGSTIDLGTVLGVSASVSPTAALESIDLQPSQSCDDCIKLLLTAGGEAAWAAGSLKGSLPFELSTTATLQLSTAPAAGGFSLSGDLVEISKLELSELGAAGLNVDLSGSLADWVRERIVDQVPQMTLAQVGGDGLPVRDLRMVAERDALRVELLTDAAHGGPLSSSDTAVPADGWEAAVSQQTLLDMARRAAFEHGEVTEDVWVEPSALSVSRDHFTLGLRVWKLSGLGWWRDYEVTGSLALDGSAIVLNPTEAVERDASSGAGLVDPLALLAQGIILDAIVDAVAQSFPLPETQSIGGSTLAVSLDSVRGRGGALTAEGEATISGASERERGASDKAEERTGHGGKKKGGKRPPR